MKTTRVLITSAFLIALPISSWASLGNDVASVNTDATKLNATINTQYNDNYTVYELSLPSTTLVKEYVNSSGNVFAVTWKGPHNPNIHQLLDNYFIRLQDKPSFADHASARFIESDFHASVRGSIHNHYGKAYLPQLLPANVTGGDIK